MMYTLPRKICKTSKPKNYDFNLHKLGMIIGYHGDGH